MAGWIGTLAHMQRFGWPTSLKTSAPSRYTLQSAAGMTWAFVNSPLTPRNREWSLDLSASNADSAVLEAFLQGAYGDGPFHFITEEAALTNVLTPAQSLLAGVSNSGYLITSDGTLAPASVVGGAEVVLADRVPALPGQPLTVSVDAAGFTELVIQPQTVTGANAGGAKTVRAEGSLMQRVHAFIPALPATARSIKISARGFTALARPQVVWASQPAPWELGAGADSVILTEGSTSYGHFEMGQREFWREISLTVKEVG